MTQFLKFKLVIALKSDFHGVNFINKCQNLVVSKVEKSNYKIAKFEVENF